MSCPHPRQTYFGITLPCARHGCPDNRGAGEDTILAFEAGGGLVVDILFTRSQHGTRWNPQPGVDAGQYPAIAKALIDAGLSGAIRGPLPPPAPPTPSDAEVGRVARVAYAAATIRAALLALQDNEERTEALAAANVCDGCGTVREDGDGPCHCRNDE